jgi:hypothetical protein
MAGCTARRRYVIPVLYGGSGIAVRRWENDANDWDAAVFYGGIFTVVCVSLYCPAESVLQYWRMGLAILDVRRWSWVKIGVDMGVRRERIG